MTTKELLAAYAAGERSFAEANLSGADLSGADLSGVKGIRRSDWERIQKTLADSIEFAD